MLQVKYYTANEIINQLYNVIELHHNLSWQQEKVQCHPHKSVCECSCSLPAASCCLWDVYSCSFHNKTLFFFLNKLLRDFVHITLFFGNQLCEWVAGCVWNDLNADALGQEKSVMTVSQLWLITALQLHALPPQRAASLCVGKIQ